MLVDLLLGYSDFHVLHGNSGTYIFLLHLTLEADAGRKTWDKVHPVVNDYCGITCRKLITTNNIFMLKQLEEVLYNIKLFTT